MRVLAALVIGGVLLAGCAKKNPPIVGTWVGNHEIKGLPARLEDTYHADGRFTGKATVDGPTGQLIATDTGTWKLEGKDKLTVILNDVDWELKGPGPAAVLRMRERFLADKAQILKEANEDNPSTLVWKGEDEFAEKSKDMTVTYRRKK